jgi:hypothetical protein
MGHILRWCFQKLYYKSVFEVSLSIVMRRLLKFNNFVMLYEFGKWNNRKILLPGTEWPGIQRIHAQAGLLAGTMAIPVHPEIISQIGLILILSRNGDKC